MEDLIYRSPREPLVHPGGIVCHVRDMTATISADVPLAQLQLKLAEHEQWLPIDGDPSQSAGTLVSCDSTGPLRLGFGAWRDLLLGAQFTNGRGELISAGGRTVKNVAGYDLTKFMVGQRGVFGSLVTLTTRTYRRPTGGILARHRPDAGIVSRLIPTPLKPHWAVLTPNDLFCGYLGDEPALAFYRSAVARSEPLEIQDRSLEQDTAHRNELWSIEGPIVFRASVPPASLGNASQQLRDIQWTADAAFGIIVGTVESEPQMEPVRKSINALQGTIKFFRGAFGPISELSTTPDERQIIERLKYAFDADQKLNPLPWPRL
jgi:glycolate oxidase FAD binding subunit